MSEAKGGPDQNEGNELTPVKQEDMLKVLGELFPQAFIYDPTTGTASSVYSQDSGIPTLSPQRLPVMPMRASGPASETGSGQNEAYAPRNGLIAACLNILNRGPKAENNNNGYPGRPKGGAGLGENNNGYPGGPKGGGGLGEGGVGGAGGGDGDPYAKVTLADVGGLDEQVTWLQEAVLSHMKDNLLLEDFGLTPPKGILFYGPPGTGKTLLARAFGNELSYLTGKKVTFFHQRGPDCYVPLFGESERILRDLFARAQKCKPSVIFFDELDGLCPSREGLIGEVAASVVTTLLGCMDSLPAGDVFVFGATNLIDSVDPAMIRPGRFDKHLEFYPPSFEGRKAIIEIHTKKWKRSQPTGKKLEEMAAKTQGYTGADLEMLAREAVTSAMERTVPSMVDFYEKSKNALDKMEVTDQDWATAFKLVKPSPPAFNSPVYIPVLPHPIVNPLVNKYQDAIIHQLIPRLPKDTKTAEDDKGPTHSSIHNVNSLLIVDEEEDDLERYVLPGIFSHSEVSKLPAYVLSSQRLHTNRLGSSECLTKTMNTVFNCGKPCILYVQMIDAIIDEHPYLLQPLAYNLQLLKGKDVLLLATSATDYSELPIDFNFKSVFSEKAMIYSLPPTAAETKAFFAPLIREVMRSLEGDAEALKDLNKLSKDILFRLRSATTKEHLNMHDMIIGIVEDEKNAPGIMENLKKSIHEFGFRNTIIHT